jgi:hypothetical protein
VLFELVGEPVDLMSQRCRIRVAGEDVPQLRDELGDPLAVPVGTLQDDGQRIGDEDPSSTVTCGSR